MWISQDSHTQLVKLKIDINFLGKIWYYLVYLKMHRQGKFSLLLISGISRETLINSSRLSERRTGDNARRGAGAGSAFNHEKTQALSMRKESIAVFSASRVVEYRRWD